MTLPELCEPLFQYVCRLNRMGRKNAPLTHASVRAEIVGIFEDMRTAAAREPGLSAKFQSVELPLIFFVDAVIADAGLSISNQWNKDRLAYQRNELAGDEKFFDLLDETMAEKGVEADERLAIFYTCLGLGFQGWYAGQPEYLRKKMLDLGKRIPARFIDTQHTARVCPEAYQHVDARDLVEAPGLKVATMAIFFGGLFFVALAVNIYLFHTASTGLAESLKTILSHDISGAR